jgi:hypothetical protein
MEYRERWREGRMPENWAQARNRTATEALQALTELLETAVNMD